MTKPRRAKEDLLARLLHQTQQQGVIRADMEPALLAASIFILIRGIYHPNLFVSHNISVDSAGDAIVTMILQGILTD